MSKGYSLMDEFAKNRQNGKGIIGGVNLSDVDMEDYDWLWEDWICRGKIHVMAGDGGIGKTQVLCLIASIVSRGGVFPGTKERCKQQRVLYFSGEDGASDTIKPRIVATAGNPENVTVMNREFRNEFLNIPSHYHEIEDTIEHYGDVGLMIIDPVTVYCGEKHDNNSPTSVRLVLSKLTEIAERTKVAIICLTHLKKDKTGGMLARLLGAGAWSHGPRVVFGVMKSEQNNCVLFGKLKANICETVGVYPFQMQTKELDGLDREVTYVDWVTDHMWHEELSVLESEEENQFPTYGSKTDEACTIISETLAHRMPVAREELIAKADKQRISPATMNKAASLLNVKRERTNEIPSTTTWRLQ